MILGHAALSVLGKETFFRSIPLPVLLIATYAPDLIDKTDMILFGTPAQFIGHTFVLFFTMMTLVPATFIFIRVSPNKFPWLVVALFWLSHLLLDFTAKIVLFWPLFGDFPCAIPYDLSEGFFSFYSGQADPLGLTLEIFGDFSYAIPYGLSERFFSFYSGQADPLGLTLEIVCILLMLVVLVWQRHYSYGVRHPAKGMASKR